MFNFLLLSSMAFTHSDQAFLWSSDPCSGYREKVRSLMYFILLASNCFFPNLPRTFETFRSSSVNNLLAQLAAKFRRDALSLCNVASVASENSKGILDGNVVGSL